MKEENGVSVHVAAADADYDQRNGANQPFPAPYEPNLNPNGSGV